MHGDPEAETTLCGVEQQPLEPGARPRTLDEIMPILYAEQRTREDNARADRGQAWLDQHWIEIALDVLADAPDWVTQGARHEYLRCNGIDPRTLKPAEPTDEMSADG